MTRKVLVGLFLAVFGLAMANITLADHMSGDDQVMCTKEYKPVCGEVQVVCIKAPCYPVIETFGNRCEANAAHATNIQEGTCESQSQKLHYTSWKLAAFDGAEAEGVSTLYFGLDKLNAKVCNSKAGSYSAANGKLMVGPLMSTLMACMGAVGTYESAFNLSGASYGILGDKLTIDTTEGHRFVRTRRSTVPAANEERKYGFVSRQIDQLIKAKQLTTVEQKKTFVAGLIDKLEAIMEKAKYTRYGYYKVMFIKSALQYYYDHIQ